jgi:Bacterial capsule synthesis protein PGA_cap.
MAITNEVTEDVMQVVEAISKILPTSNRDESKMTVVVMSGTTAITRGLAYKVTINDTEYPIKLVKDWFLSADLRHVSNEAPFYEDCPYPDPYTSSLVFCTSPDMIEVLENIGVNVVELTGNHIKDYLEENLLYTMQLYKDRGWYFYAAGENAAVGKRTCADRA